MNVNPVANKKSRETDGGVENQSMNFSLGVPKGMRHVLEKRGNDTQGMKADDMHVVLGSHPDSKTRSLLLSTF